MLLFFLVLFLSPSALYSHVQYCPFAESMRKCNQKKGRPLSKNVYVFRANFEKFFHTAPATEPLIPKKIHFIWFGSTMPEIYRFCINSWVKHHPDWELYFWDEQKVKDEQFSCYQLYQNDANPGSRSDVARIDILNRYGGVYIDTDFYCLQSLNPIVSRTTFFAATAFSGSIFFNGIVGAAPNHPFLQSTLASLRHRPDAKVLLKGPSKRTVVKATGPHFISRVFLELYRSNPQSFAGVIFPASYFYGAPANVRLRFWNGKLGLVDLLQQHTYPESFAVHLWANSWIGQQSEMYVERALQRLGFHRDQLNAKDPHLLIKAVRNKDIHAVRLLLYHGLAPWQKNESGECAHACAQAVGDERILREIQLFV